MMFLMLINNMEDSAVWHYPDFIFTHMIMHPHNTKITTNTTVHKAQRSLWPPEFKQRAKLSNRKLKCHALFEHHRDQIYHQETIERVEMLNFLFKAHIKKNHALYPYWGPRIVPCITISHLAVSHWAENVLAELLKSGHVFHN